MVLQLVAVLVGAEVLTDLGVDSPVLLRVGGQALLEPFLSLLAQAVRHAGEDHDEAVTFVSCLCNDGQEVGGLSTLYEADDKSTSLQVPDRGHSGTGDDLVAGLIDLLECVRTEICGDRLPYRRPVLVPVEVSTLVPAVVDLL